MNDTRKLTALKTRISAAELAESRSHSRHTKNLCGNTGAGLRAWESRGAGNTFDFEEPEVQALLRDVPFTKIVDATGEVYFDCKSPYGEPGTTDINLKTTTPSPSGVVPRMRSILAGVALAIGASALEAAEDFIVMGDVIGPVRAFTVVELDNGDMVSFVALPDENGKKAGVLITEKISPGRHSVHALPQLRDANALEIYKAIAEPEDLVPSILKELYSDSTRTTQGWARDGSLIDDDGNTNSSCPAAYGWSDRVENYGDLFNHTPFKSTWNGPTTEPQHWKWIGTNGLGGAQPWELNGLASSVTAFYVEILYCVEDYEHAETYEGNYVGNYVSSYFRLAGHESWNFSQGMQLENTGQSFSHTWSPSNKFQVYATNYDFRVTVSQAKQADEFHIGATWVDGLTSVLSSGK